MSSDTQTPEAEDAALEAAEAARRKNITVTAHKSIFLQQGEGGEAFDGSNATWCEDRIGDDDVAYIRADLHETELAALREELEGVRGRARCASESCGKELHCENCHCDYVVWYAPNEAWNKAVRSHTPEGEAEPFLCPTCFCRFAEARGFEDGVWGMFESDSKARRRRRRASLSKKGGEPEAKKGMGDA